MQLSVEMKGKGKDNDLRRAFEQTRQKYMPHLSDEEFPDLWMLCDFENIHITRHSTKEFFKFKTADLRKHVMRFANIAGYETERGRGEQIEVNVKAAEKMAKLYDALKDLGYDGHELEVYLVRLLFCLFADDTGIFPKDRFYNYIEQSKADGSDLSHRIADLFEVPNMPDDIRAKKTMLSEELRGFRYINGNLFSLRLPPADFNAKMRQTLLTCIDFDWNTISPAIFGAMFQGVMDKAKRREMGAHYTSEENIEKLINPLFMDDLYKEFERVKTDPAALDRFHEKIARLKFLDPACGCGNFLIVTYGKLRELELEILKMKNTSAQLVIDISSFRKVSVEQFYGIEYEEFPCQTAQVGMWLTDHQMNLRLEELGIYHVDLPLGKGAAIVHGNALRLNWEDIVPKNELSYILGNPPFLGARVMSAAQKEDMAQVFGKMKNLGNLDYVTAWYKKAADMMKDTRIKSAFVSTNSIAQGEQPAILWKPLMEQGIFINFGAPTFKWSNEAKGKAAVYCVIVGFSRQKTEPNINQYLPEAPTVFIEKRSKPLTDAPPMNYGSFALDDGNYTISQDEREEILSANPDADKFLRPFIGARELLHNEKRYCVWLQNVSPAEINKCVPIKQRVENVRNWRMNSKRQNTMMLADTPTLFAEIRQPDDMYLVIPTVSSEKRRYMPIAYLPPTVVASNQLYIIPNATLYHFGILTSNVHMAWTRAVCGRLEMRYSYSNTIVYNNFPWPDATDTQKAVINKLAQGVLNARAKYPDSTLADMYGETSMLFHTILLNAHRELDRAVMKLYGFPVKDFTEADCVAALMEMYQKLADGGGKK